MKRKFAHPEVGQNETAPLRSIAEAQEPAVELTAGREAQLFNILACLERLPEKASKQRLAFRSHTGSAAPP